MPPFEFITMARDDIRVKREIIEAIILGDVLIRFRISHFIMRFNFPEDRISLHLYDEVRKKQTGHDLEEGELI
ncbi:hypothetical protein C0J52_02163 [Blattella germanica]|nr:hypothetical protein C0J52_02163 [Blattella germanica]